MMEKKIDQSDVVVIGGGPAGSTAASLLAEKGWNVEIWEKDSHPKFHIGESLLPHTLPILERLGVLEDIEKIGLRKYGAELLSPYHQHNVTLYFKEALDKTHPYAFQVRRAQFDEILFNNCKKKGVVVREGLEVKDVRFSTNNQVTLVAMDRQGVKVTKTTRFLVDASGRQTFLGTQLGLKQRSVTHNSAALFSHFTGVVRHKGKDEGNISICWFNQGWFWIIPFRDGITSVGVVCWPSYLKQRKGSAEEFFWDAVHRCPPMAERMSQAKSVMPIMATGNYSYQCSSMLGANYILLGDAFAFVDPVFSSGVHLALNSAIRGVEVVEATLREMPELAEKQQEFVASVKRGIATYSWFIHRFTQPAFRALFMAPKNYFRMKEAVLSVLAGDVFDKTPVTIPILLFKVVYYVTSFLDLPGNWAQVRLRKGNARDGQPWTELMSRGTSQ